MLALLTGCYAKQFKDVSKVGLSPHVVGMKTTDTTITFHVLQDQSVWLADIKPKIIENNVYLSPLYISSPVSVTNFTLDFSDPRYPKDWKQRLYWIEEDSITSPLNPFLKRVQTIGRRRIEL